MQTQDNEITENQPDPAPESTEQHTPETTPSLEEMIRQAELKAEEHHDAWLRAKAETENVRRRAQEDIAKASKFAVERFAGELLIHHRAHQRMIGLCAWLRRDGAWAVPFQQIPDHGFATRQDPYAKRV